jgi:hypothetical protein
MEVSHNMEYYINCTCKIWNFIQKYDHLWPRQKKTGYKQIVNVLYSHNRFASFVKVKEVTFSDEYWQVHMI